MRICVFLSAADLDERYTRPAREFVVADGVQAAGGRLEGISVQFLRRHARNGADEMLVAQDLAERKALLLDRADAIVVMAGGLGTLDEATEILEQRKHGLHN